MIRCHPTLPARTEVEEAGDPIDAVYLWVDGSDPAFRASLSDARARRPPGRTADASPRRFRDHDELRHSLRSLERHAPWIRRVHIVTNGQVPRWLDRSNGRVDVVTHREIFPDAALLPTFNSHAVEWRLHAIPGLARRFLYLNDDLFLGRDVRRADYLGPGGTQRLYFEQNRIRTAVKTGATHDLAYAFTLGVHDRRRPRASARRHPAAYDVRLRDRLRGRPPRRLLPAHVPQLYARDLVARLADAFAEEVELTTVHTFRSADDLVLRIVYAYHLLEARDRTSEPQATRLAWDSEEYAFAPLVADVGRVQAGFERITSVGPRFICVNDDLPDDAGDDHPSRRALRDWMQAAYPTPSTFERPS